MGEDSNHHAYVRRVTGVLDPPSPVLSHTRSHDQLQVNINTHRFGPGSNPSTHESFRVEDPSVCLGYPSHLDRSDPFRTSTTNKLTGQFPFDHTPSLQEYQNVQNRSRISIERDLRRVLTDLGYKLPDIEKAVRDLDDEMVPWNFKRQNDGSDSRTHQRPSEPFSAFGSSGEQDSECIT
jgi:hypothetical protein